MTEKNQERINDALLKVALGCQVTEIAEEYAEVDGELKLTKRKKTKRDIPPDLKAVQLLMASEQNDYSCMTDGELETEKARLLAMLGDVAKMDNSAMKNIEKKTERKRGEPMKKRRLTKKTDKEKQ